MRLSRDTTTEYAVTPAGGAGSHLLGGLAMADALAVSPADVEQVEAGSEVELLLLRPRGEIDGRLDEEEERAEREAASGGTDGEADR
ncbi:hypothetical protein [Ornithinimicrobium flavum]|uniref:hypothetical protein n=1 Tax=Ornithinimicrobium flavum TaxID=1288636 RepID=UPI00193102DF|nr:hypothetical protein [Ornithinimicrobium flavum]